MVDQKPNEEGPRVPIRLEVKTEKDITPQDLAEFEEFVQRHSQSYLEMGAPLAEESQDKGEAAWVHSIARGVLLDSVRGECTVSVVFARNQSGLVGYSVVVLNPEEAPPSERVLTTFLGVREDMQHLGIGTELLKTRLEILKSMGISEYTTRVVSRVVGLYDRLGIKYTTELIPDRPDAQRLHASF